MIAPCGEAEPHDCRKNWVGSAKSMEASAAVDIAKDLVQQGATIRCVVGDEDLSAIKRLRHKVDAEIQKSSNMNHLKKNLGNRPCALRDSGH